jgi:hypothetical protein
MPGADFRVLYIDEATCYRQPTIANTWWPAGKGSPMAHLSHRSNIRIRIAGALDVEDGRVHYQMSRRCGVIELTCFWKRLEKAYPDCKKIYLVMDNWPVHFHDSIWEKLNAGGRIKAVPLPTYSPWLNPIEKLWRYLKQHVVHMHDMADDINGLKNRISSVLDELKPGSQELLRYAGICIK